MASNGFISPQRNAHRNANAGTTLKRRSDYLGCGSIEGFQEERNRCAPPQKRPRIQTQAQFRSANPDRIPLYHGSNVSRVSQSYNYNGDVIGFNSINSLPFALRDNDSLPSMTMAKTDYQKPVGYGIPNPQRVPLPLPYRKLDVSFDSLPEWVPNQSGTRTLNRSIPNFVPNTNGDITGRLASQAPTFTNFQNPMPMNHANMFSTVSQVIPQPIVSKDLTDLQSVLNNEKDKQNSEASNNNNESPLGLSFDMSLLKVRHESVIKSLYSDMPRQCSSCGLRFKCQEEHRNHMDWHVRKNRMAKDANKTTSRQSQSQKLKKSRGWFASSSIWLIAATGGAKEAVKASSSGETQKKEEEVKQHVVPADEDQKMCALCQEPFEEFFSHEADDWLYKDAVYLNKNKHTNTLGPIVHAKCMPETRKEPAKDLREPMGMSVTVPSVASALVC